MPVQFFPCFSVSQKRKTKQSPIDLKIDGDYFWTRRSPRSIGDRTKEFRGHHQDKGCTLPLGAPPTLVVASWMACCVSNFNSKSSGLLSVQERSSRRFHSVWTPFGIPFLQNSKIGKKTETGTGPPVNRLVSKIFPRS